MHALWHHLKSVVAASNVILECNSKWGVYDRSTCQTFEFSKRLLVELFVKEVKSVRYPLNKEGSLLAVIFCLLSLINFPCRCFVHIVSVCSYMLLSNRYVGLWLSLCTLIASLLSQGRLDLLSLILDVLNHRGVGRLLLYDLSTFVLWWRPVTHWIAWVLWWLLLSCCFSSEHVPLLYYSACVILELFILTLY